MQPTNTRKRRLEALSRQQQQSHAGSSQQGGQATAAAVRTRPGSGQAASAPPSAPSAAGTDTSVDPPAFPYLPLGASGQPTAHTASRVQLPPAAACQGNVEDALRDLMRPYMPVSVAESMIATRTAADKAVILINPTSRINLAKPSSSSRGQRARLSDKLLPRAQRVALTALPKSGIDYAAMLALHELWAKYAGGVLASAAPETLERLLNTLDWHGALLRVTGSRNPIYLHRVGVVAKATHNTFVLVSDDGRSSTVPLKGSSFECSIDCGRTLHVVLTGDNLKVLKCCEKVD